MDASSIDKQELIENMKAMIRNSTIAPNRTNHVISDIQQSIDNTKRSFITVSRKGEKFQVREKSGRRKTFGTFPTIEIAEVVADVLEEVYTEQNTSQNNNIVFAIKDLINERIQETLDDICNVVEELKKEYGIRQQ